MPKPVRTSDAVRSIEELEKLTDEVRHKMLDLFELFRTTQVGNFVADLVDAATAQGMPPKLAESYAQDYQHWVLGWWKKMHEAQEAMEHAEHHLPSARHVLTVLPRRLPRQVDDLFLR